MDRTHVESSNITSVGYDVASRLLQVVFHSGAVYNYTDVDPEHHEGLVSSDSPGRYLNQHIKGNCPCERA